jgi:hypothetical protein
LLHLAQIKQTADLGRLGQKMEKFPCLFFCRRSLSWWIKFFRTTADSPLTTLAFAIFFPYREKSPNCIRFKTKITGEIFRAMITSS